MFEDRDPAPENDTFGWKPASEHIFKSVWFKVSSLEFCAVVGHIIKESSNSAYISDGDLSYKNGYTWTTLDKKDSVVFVRILVSSNVTEEKNDTQIKSFEPLVEFNF